MPFKSLSRSEHNGFSDQLKIKSNSNAMWRILLRLSNWANLLIIIGNTMITIYFDWFHKHLTVMNIKITLSPVRIEYNKFFKFFLTQSKIASSLFPFLPHFSFFLGEPFLIFRGFYFVIYIKKICRCQAKYPI